MFLILAQTTLTLPPNTLEGGYKYVIRAVAVLPTGDIGYSELSIITNLPPYGGNCTPSRLSGKPCFMSFWLDLCIYAWYVA